MPLRHGFLTGFLPDFAKNRQKISHFLTSSGKLRILTLEIDHFLPEMSLFDPKMTENARFFGPYFQYNAKCHIYRGVQKRGRRVPESGVTNGV